MIRKLLIIILSLILCLGISHDTASQDSIRIVLPDTAQIYISQNDDYIEIAKSSMIVVKYDWEYLTTDTLNIYLRYDSNTYQQISIFNDTRDLSIIPEYKRYKNSDTYFFITYEYCLIELRYHMKYRLWDNRSSNNIPKSLINFSNFNFIK